MDSYTPNNPEASGQDAVNTPEAAAQQTNAAPQPGGTTAQPVNAAQETPANAAAQQTDAAPQPGETTVQLGGGAVPPQYPVRAPYQWDYRRVNNASAARAPKKRNRGLTVFLVLLGSLVVAVALFFSASGIYRAVTGSPLIGGSSSSALPQAPSSSDSGSLPGASSAPQTSGSMPEIEIEPKPQEPSDVQIGSAMTPKDVYRLCSPSVVGVISYYDLTYTSEAQGSGIVLSEDGYIITNAHVVQGAKSYQVVLSSGEYYSADLVGYDAQTDIAVLRANGASGLTPATFGDSDQLVVGEMVVAIGNPDGLNLATSQTVGYVSALNRPITTESSYTMECIQSDAAINPGSSGGPLINEYGQVIGINSAKLADVDYEGIGFSIPINTALPIVEQLIGYGKVTGRAMLGITTKQSIDSATASYYQIPTGIVIDSFSDGSDLPDKGVRSGDIITQVGGVDVASVGDCSNVLQNYRPGESIEITLYRITNNVTYTGETFTVTVRLIGS